MNINQLNQAKSCATVLKTEGYVYDCVCGAETETPVFKYFRPATNRERRTELNRMRRVLVYLKKCHPGLLGLVQFYGGGVVVSLYPQAPKPAVLPFVTTFLRAAAMWLL